MLEGCSVLCRAGGQNCSIFMTDRDHNYNAFIAFRLGMQYLVTNACGVCMSHGFLFYCFTAATCSGTHAADVASPLLDIACAHRQ